MPPVVQQPLVLCLVGAALALSACSAVGPQMVARDRFDYNGEVARSWKEQTLLNIVRARYLDMPVFLEVAQIVSGYTLESTVSLGATDARSGARVAPGDNLTLGAQGRWTDRPTITYTPLTGAQFNRNMLTPIPPAAVLFTMQAGWPIDLVFRVVVKSINGISSEGSSAERYERVVHLMRKLQQAEVLGKKKVTVQSLIKRMLKPESLTGDNKYSCDTCGCKQDASRWIELTQLPNHLMLVMHKFSFDVATCDFKKETTAVHPDDGSIDLVGTRYELYGSILHYGESAMKGHYVAIGKRSGQSHDHNAQWALMDDSEVTMMSESEAMERLSGLKKPTDSAYVLFLKNVNAPQAVNPRMPQQIIDEALAIEAAAVHL